MSSSMLDIVNLVTEAGIDSRLSSSKWQETAQSVWSKGGIWRVSSSAHSLALNVKWRSLRGRAEKNSAGLISPGVNAAMDKSVTERGMLKISISGWIFRHFKMTRGGGKLGTEWRKIERGCSIGAVSSKCCRKLSV